MTDERKTIVQPYVDLTRKMTVDVARAGAEQRANAAAVAAAARNAMNAAVETVAFLKAQVEDYQKNLTEHEEICLIVIGGPAGMAMFPTAIDAVNPDKIVFYGEDEDGRPIVVLQHVSQLNFAMHCKSLKQEEKPRRIGFHMPE